MSKKSPTHAAGFVEPMHCLAVAKLPEGPDWEYGIKFDGYRALGIKIEDRVQLLSRNGNDFSVRYPSVVRALSKLPDDTTIDGEIVALDESGTPSSNVLQNYNQAGKPLQFFVFDLLRLRGKDLSARALLERRDLLRSKVMPNLRGGIALLSESLEATAVEVVVAVKKQGLEGVIAKRRDGRYEPGRRSGAWVKMRINKGQELVIGGYVPSGGNFDSLVAGYYQGSELLYVARVRSGFMPVLRARVFERFKGLEIKSCPFSNLPQRDKGRWGQGTHGRKDGRMPLAARPAARAAASISAAVQVCRRSSSSIPAF